MKGKAGTVPATIDEYLANVPADQRTALQALRRTIRASAPGAQEGISYGMPVFRHHGPLVYFAAFTDHCSFFGASAEIRRRFARELKSFAGGKGTVRFTPERPLPAALVIRIVKARVAENEARAAAKRRTPRASRRKR